MFTRDKNKTTKASDDEDLSEDSIPQLECRVSSDPAIWRAQVFCSYANVRDELQRLEAPGPTSSSDIGADAPKLSVEEQSIVSGCERDLREALQAMAPNDRGRGKSPRWWLGLKLFYSGTRIEQSWTATHRARALLYLLYPDKELPTQTSALQELISDLPESNTLRGSLTTTLGHLKSDLSSGGTRAGLRQIYEQAIGVIDGLQREARVLRNTLMTASAGIFLVLMVLGLAHLIDRSILVVCTPAVKGVKYCPFDGSSHPFDVFTVELAGMLGGLLSVVIPLASGERIKTPYRVFNWQLVLKTLAGAASALAGVLLVGATLIPELSIKSSAAVLGYAVFFGFSQQVVTGAVDRRANTLAKETPSAKV